MILKKYSLADQKASAENSIDKVLKLTKYNKKIVKFGYLKVTLIQYLAS